MLPAGKREKSLELHRRVVCVLDAARYCVGDLLHPIRPDLGDQVLAGDLPSVGKGGTPPLWPIPNREGAWSTGLAVRGALLALTSAAVLESLSLRPAHRRVPAGVDARHPDAPVR